jgi:hypothetical protein
MGWSSEIDTMRTFLCGLCAAVVVMPGVVGGAAESTESTTPTHGAIVPSWLSGVWQREWIEERGLRSSTLDVHYLQTPLFFGDVRIPRDRPNLSHASSFTDLSDQELHALAQQRGFAGHTTLVGTTATWHHQMDFQPPDGEEDIGRLELLAGRRMHESGPDGSYTESWKSATDGDGRFLVIQTERDGRPQRLLLVAGDYFVFVRNRIKDLPRAASLDSLIASTHPSRAQVIEYLDCDFSFGRVHGGSIAWEIQRSTLPWREGHRLEFVDELKVAEGDSVLQRTPGSERWTVPINTLSDSELVEIFGDRSGR